MLGPAFLDWKFIIRFWLLSTNQFEQVITDFSDNKILNHSTGAHFTVENPIGINKFWLIVRVYWSKFSCHNYW